MRSYKEKPAVRYIRAVGMVVKEGGRDRQDAMYAKGRFENFAKGKANWLFRIILNPLALET